MKAPFQLHAAAAILFLNALCYLFVVIPAGVKSHALFSGYRGVGFVLAICALLYVFPRIVRWIAAVLFLLAAMATLSAAARVMDRSPLFGIVDLIYSALIIYLFYQLIWGAAIKDYLAHLKAKSKIPPNQPPLQMPTSGTPAAGAPVAPPSGPAGR
jgi:hypothetical protein